MHIVSSVRGRLRPDKDAFDALAACFSRRDGFPAPRKVRAMEIIAELEPSARGVYSGSVMYLDFSGNLKLPASPFARWSFKARKAYLQAGGGIVADSDPEREMGTRR